MDKNSYSVNGNNYDSDISPLIMNDRTLLSARYVVEPFGGEIDWDPEEKKVTCRLLKPSEFTGDLTEMNVVELWINKPTAKINGVEVQIDPDNPDVVPTIINDRTMVPMRFLAENLGCEVEWIAESKEIILTYTPSFLSFNHGKE
ncbi:MAG: copper amine oxidase N-terminal domain-containing protein [Caldisericia bacterium]